MTTPVNSRGNFATPKQVAEELGCNVSSVYRAVERGELPSIRLLPRGAIKIPRSALTVLHR